MPTWDSLFGGRAELVRKMLFGSLLLKDYDPAASLTTFTPFEATTGELRSLTADGFRDAGYLSDDGVTFSPDIDGEDTGAWQSRDPLRRDVTKDSETAQFTAIETRPETLALYRSLRLAQVGAFDGKGLTMTKPKVPVMIPRSILAIGVDGEGPSAIYGAVLYPRASVTDRGDHQWSASEIAGYELTITPYHDSVAGFAIRWWYDGPGWRALGNTAPASGGAALTTSDSTDVNPTTGGSPSTSTTKAGKAA